MALDRRTFFGLLATPFAAAISGCSLFHKRQRPIPEQAVCAIEPSPDYLVFKGKIPENVYIKGPAYTVTFDKDKELTIEDVCRLRGIPVP